VSPPSHNPLRQAPQVPFSLKPELQQAYWDPPEQHPRKARKHVANAGLGPL